MIGLIFGETEFPKYILKKIYKKKKYILIDLTKKKFLKKEKFLSFICRPDWQGYFDFKKQQV